MKYRCPECFSSGSHIPGCPEGFDEEEAIDDGAIQDVEYDNWKQDQVDGDE